MQQQQAEAFLKANNQKDGAAHLSQKTEILLYSICNGTFATVAFFVFLYFIFRHIMKISEEASDVREKQVEEGRVNGPPPSYNEVVNAVRY